MYDTMLQPPELRCPQNPVGDINTSIIAVDRTSTGSSFQGLLKTAAAREITLLAALPNGRNTGRATSEKTNRYTRKYRNIIANENIFLLVDSRANQPSDFSMAVALTIIGSAREAENNDRERLVSLYLTKHPNLSQFINNPSQAVIRIAVTDCVVASFDKVLVMHIDD